MQKINFFEFDKQTDLPELSSWKSKFGKTEVFQNIVQFILRNENATLFKELHFAGALDKFGKQQRKTIIAKNEQNEIVGFITLDEEKSDAVYVKFIVVSPKFAHKGYGKEILSKTIKNIEKILNKKIKTVYANIKTSNKASQKLFESVGFNKSNVKGLSKLVQYEICPENILESSQNQPS